MSDFQSFAAAHGLIIHDLEYGRWCRVPTEDHPTKKNGCYKLMGDVAFVRNWATMDESATWFPAAENKIMIDHVALKRTREKAHRELIEGRQRAAKKAGWICHQTVQETHSYLDSRGFPDLLGMVWHKTEEENLLVVPMRIEGKIVGCQTIDRDGDKRFLYGQQTKGAEYLIDNKGRDWIVEGYATGLSLRLALHALKVRYKVHITFSAHNLTQMARELPGSLVVADNDLSGAGEAAAKASGRPYLLPPPGDFNDWHRDIGLFRISQELRKWLASKP